MKNKTFDWEGWIKNKKPCIEAVDWFKAQDERRLVKIIKRLKEQRRFKWAFWAIPRLLINKKDIVRFSIFAAESVILIFEKKHPKDLRPREAISAAKKYLRVKFTNKQKIKAAAYAAAAYAYAAANAAYAAYAAANAAYAAAAYAYAAANAAYAAANAAYAAYAAAAYAYAAANAAYDAAAYDAAYAAYDVGEKIIDYGIKLLSKRRET